MSNAHGQNCPSVAALMQKMLRARAASCSAEEVAENAQLAAREEFPACPQSIQSVAALRNSPPLAMDGICNAIERGEIAGRAAASMLREFETWKEECDKVSAAHSVPELRGVATKAFAAWMATENTLAHATANSLSDVMVKLEFADRMLEDNDVDKLGEIVASLRRDIERMIANGGGAQ